MNKKIKRFTGAYEPRSFFDRRVRVQGGSRVLSLGKIIPDDWGWVRVWKLDETPKSITVHFERLELKPVYAPVEGDNKEGE